MNRLAKALEAGGAWSAGALKTAFGGVGRFIRYLGLALGIALLSLLVATAAFGVVLRFWDYWWLDIRSAPVLVFARVSSGSAPFVWTALTVIGVLALAVWRARQRRQAGEANTKPWIEKRVAFAEWTSAIASVAAVLVAASTFLFLIDEKEDRKNARIIRAWTVLHEIGTFLGKDGADCVYGPPERQGNLGQMDALEALHADGVDLRRINVAGYFLGAVNLRGALLTNADFTCANLAGANLAGVFAPGANFSRAQLSGLNAFRTNLSGARFDKAIIAGSGFSGASLQAVRLKTDGLTDVDFSDADLTYASFVGRAVAGPLEAPSPPIVERDFDLYDRYFDRACLKTEEPGDIPEPAFSGGYQFAGGGQFMSWLDFNRANLRRADFCGARMANITFRGSDLTQANLVAIVVAPPYPGMASARPTDFSGAVLRETDLTGADLRFTTGLTQEQLDAACADPRNGPFLPAGLTSPPKECPHPVLEMYRD